MALDTQGLPHPGHAAPSHHPAWRLRAKSKIKTLSKKVEAAVEANDKAVAAEALKVATTEIDKACSKGVYHKNTAARKVSRLTNLVNAMN